jgi:Fungal specific transcription factor domain/Fungal Zn(2)-Cys(6) binuclear cluster domain
MSAPQVEAPRLVSSPQPQSSAPRKRRKRVPATGVADDCFNCSSLSISCDRRKPFCSQCLDNGKNCSGYKTQLTWGVGVASRGKLRGLSLPIAGSTQRASGPLSPTKQKKKRALAGERKLPIQSSSANPKSELISPTDTRRSLGFNYGQNDALPMPGGTVIPTSAPWHPPSIMNATSPSSESTSIKSGSFGSSISEYQFENVHPSTQDLYGGPPPATSHSLFNVNGPTSPMPYSEPPPSALYLGTSMYHGKTFRPITHDSRTYRIPDLLSPNPIVTNAVSNSMYMYHVPPETYFHDQPQAFPMATNGVKCEEDIEDIGRGIISDEIAVIDDMSSLASPIPMDFTFNLRPFGMTTIGKTPRIQYLINYYAEVISPVIVAFDGPSNPYRTQILRLAAESETLQHAIAALSASNLRQRRETGAISSGKTDPARRSSMAHLTLTDRSFHSAAPLSPQEQAREESFHKSFAIQSLNAQLADPVLRRNDSILATLLVLCLFHICDSGVAKFQTQFAGVKKLLSLRGHELGIETKEAKWFTRMFTWFDAMTATVNDREGQLQGHHLEITALSDEGWTLENLAGCDGQLFKIIAKLGRLNVLAQGKDVDENPTIISRPLPNPFSVADYSKFDVNGWARIIADDNLFTSKTAKRDVQTQFWREWKEIRQALQMWQFDMSLFDSASNEAPLLSVEQRVDLANISESFRYSSLLYTERLAFPTAASSEPNIQSWVRKSLDFIKEVKSDVYLLWPLFITGSECVNEADIEIIRERCLDIQRDSGFYNNQSCLELLEKVWKKRDSQNVNGEKFGFRFTEVMKAEENEGEYIVV